MNIATQKDNLIKWIQTIEDSKILNKIESIKSEETFDFEKEWARSISGDELREKNKKTSKIITLEKISIQYLPEIENFINDLSDLLFEKEYFSFYEYSADYVNKLTFFIEKELFNFPHKSTPKKLKKFGSNYAFYRPNERTTWYIFFEKSNNRYLITHLTNNHVKELNDL